MTLVLEIEHLVGVAFAAPSQASVLPDWPPQPDRVFSALVAAWGARGERTDERRALEWLEAQPMPEIAASGGSARSAATVFVPPNDPETGRVGNRSIMPAFRRRQPRRFPAFRPDDPVMCLIWRDLKVDDEMLATLNCLARDTPYVGHSASLTRCRFRVDPAVEPGVRPRRRVYRGRLSELERAHQAGRRPNYGADVDASSATDENRHPKSVFASRWLVLECVGGTMPDLRAAAPVGKALRNAVMSGYKRTVGEAAVPAIVSGHSADGMPIASEHLAIVPMAFVGWPHADGRVLGFALVPPGDGALLDDSGFQNAMRSIAPWNSTSGQRELILRADGFDIVFSLAPDGDRRSLDPASYVASARTWASCTPIVVDRHLKASGNAARDLEAREAIARACRNIGLPSPSLIRNADTAPEELPIAVSKHSAFKEVPSAYPSGRAPSWTRWRLPASVASRQLTHAVVQFDQPVRGPVILGAGRFSGLGLCRALDPEAR